MTIGCRESRRYRALRSGQGCALCAVILSALLTAAPADASPRFVVVAQRGAGPTDLPSSVLGRLFLLQVSEFEGRRLRPANLADPDARLEFLQKLTGRTRREIESLFVAMELRGEGTWPEEFATGETLAAAITRDPSLVGWMSADDFGRLDPIRRESLVVLKVDGIGPAAAGYHFGH